MTDETAPLVPDGWELRPGGTAMLSLNGRRFTLKAPSFGELRAISETVEAATDALLLRAHELDARTAELAEMRKTGAVDPGAASLEDRKLGREWQRTKEDAWWDVLGDIFALLGSANLPPRDDDQPGWFPITAEQQVGTLLTHWRSGPKARGSR